VERRVDVYLGKRQISFAKSLLKRHNLFIVHEASNANDQRKTSDSFPTAVSGQLVPNAFFYLPLPRSSSSTNLSGRSPPSFLSDCLQLAKRCPHSTLRHPSIGFVYRCDVASPSAESKAQHYIPKFYLKGFTDEQKRLWVCEKFKPIRASKPKDEAHRPDYYTHAEQGERDETAEDILKQAESRAAPIICKLANPQYRLTPENAGRVLIFIAFMFARVPSWREHLDNVAAQIARDGIVKTANDKEKFYRIWAELEKKNGKPLGMEPEKLRQYILKGEYDLTQGSTGFNLGAMFTSAFSAAKELAKMGYQSLYAPEGSFFLTSDSPVFTLQPDGMGQATIGMGFGLENVEVYFPLNKRTCFRMKKGIQPKGTIIEAGKVDLINNVTMATAAQYLYSSQGFRKIARLFDEHGCKIRAGKNAFMTNPPSPGDVRLL
jgi:hypothetical protein